MPPSGWQGAEEHDSMAPPPFNAFLTVSKVAGGVVVPPFGTHALVPPAPDSAPSSRLPAQPASGDNRTITAATATFERRNFILWKSTVSLRSRSRGRTRLPPHPQLKRSEEPAARAGARARRL